MREESCVYHIPAIILPFAMRSLDLNACSTLANNKLHSLAGMGPGDVKESFYLCDPSQRALQELHPVLENGRDQLARFFTDTQALANRLLRAMEIRLKVRLEPQTVLCF